MPTHTQKRPAIAEGSREIVHSTAPLRLAESYLARHWTQDGSLRLRRYRGEWYQYTGAGYEPHDEEAMRATVYVHIDTLETPKLDKDGEQVQDKKTGEPKYLPVRPTRNVVAEVCSAIPACGALVQGGAPLWLNAKRSQHDPSELLAMSNGILHWPSRLLLPSTAEFFTTTGVDYAFDPHAAVSPDWIEALQTYWPGDQEAIDTLQEWFGYVVFGDTAQEKILLLVGPKRSGKGTIATVLSELVGTSNVCTPTLAGLGTQFGLQPLLNTRLAVIGDARIGSRSDAALVTERLLSISGRDGTDVDRKNLPSLQRVKLATRFMVLTNELPRIDDASGALAGRFIVLTLKESFYGREKQELKTKLISDLPSILLWALDGWDRLRARGKFVQPASSKECIQQLEDLGSPVGAFVRDWCQVKAGNSVDTGDLYTAWQAWCERSGRKPGADNIFGRNLRAVVPGIRTTQPNDNGKRYRQYEGVALTYEGLTALEHHVEREAKRELARNGTRS